MEVYLDNSATTPLCVEAVDKMELALTGIWGNPSSLHKTGIRAAEELKKARAAVAESLSCSEDEIIFTSGGTEGNNIAIFGAVNALKRRGNRIITTSIEHSSVEEPFKHLATLGFEVIRINVDHDGRIDEEQLYRAINSSTIFVSVMAVNNETGTIQPITAVRRAVYAAGSPALIHCDAVQAFGKIDLKQIIANVDLMTISAHKIHGPKGAGALYIKKGVRISQHSFGGGQEKEIRPGTEPTPAIFGFGAAVKALPDVYEELARVSVLRDYFVSRLHSIDGIIINSPANALPYVINLSVLGIPSEVMLNFLSERGIFISSGSACSKGGRSRVLTAMKLNNDRIDSALRVSLSRFTTKEEIDLLLFGIKDGLRKLRRVK